MSLLRNIVNKGRFVSPEQFSELLKAPEFGPRVVPLDASWFMPNSNRNAKKEFVAERLPGAVFFDIDAVKDESSPYPHMMPSKKEFDKSMGSLGLKLSDLLVVYDSVGNFSAPRAHWMLRAFQHPETVLLNSFPAYKKTAAPLTNGPLQDVLRSPSQYQSPGLNSKLVVLFEELVDLAADAAKRETYYLVDARPAGRFSGSDPEPREGLSSGHVPGAISVPFSELVKDGVFLSRQEISQVFSDKGVGKDKPIIIMCGTGVTACVIEAGLRESEYTTEDIRVYDGSWTEWAQRADPSLIVKDV